jgi:hypothetical protein
VSLSSLRDRMWHIGCSCLFSFPLPLKASRSKQGGHVTLQAGRVEDVLRRVQGEFLEMPGLRLTPAQARRLWGLDAMMCEQLLAALVDAKFLFKTRDGAFMLVEARPLRTSSSRIVAA